MSSIAAKTGDITSAPGYGPSKAAIDALTKTLARQLAEYGIHVNGVAPHAIETEMSAEWSEEKRRAIIAAIPLKRLGRPQEVAEAVLFLASDKAGFITGEILDVKADESVLNEDGLPDIEKVKPIIFGPEIRTYHALGKFLGAAFSMGRKA